jgi:hypothetical protein
MFCVRWHAVVRQQLHQLARGQLAVAQYPRGFAACTEAAHEKRNVITDNFVT